MDQNHTTSQGARILVVDDDQLMRDMTLRRLAKLGYRAIAAASGAEALEALASGADVDLLLTDIRMPGGLHGPALAKEARRLRPQIKVLFVTGAPDDTHAAGRRRRGWRAASPQAVHQGRAGGEDP